MTALLDVNVLVALAWPNHVHHEAAHAWFDRTQGDGWATCPMTETGFVRVSSNQAVIPMAVTPREAVALLREIVALAGHQFWPDDLRFGHSSHVATEKLGGFRQVTDAHLLGLALRHGGRLVTFDSRVRTLLPSGARPDAIEVVPANVTP